MTKKKKKIGYRDDGRREAEQTSDKQLIDKKRKEGEKEIPSGLFFK